MLTTLVAASQEVQGELERVGLHMGNILPADRIFADQDLLLFLGLSSLRRARAHAPNPAPTKPYDPGWPSPSADQLVQLFRPITRKDGMIELFEVRAIAMRITRVRFAHLT